MPGEGFQPMFQSPLGEVVKETKTVIKIPLTVKTFQSPLGEVVKETAKEFHGRSGCTVSIPSRGSGKGDSRRNRH